MYNYTTYGSKYNGLIIVSAKIVYNAHLEWHPIAIHALWRYVFLIKLAINITFCEAEKEVANISEPSLTENI